MLKEIPSEWVAKTGLFEVHTEIADKDEYLTRPDKGRRLSKEAIDIILAKCKKNPQVQVVVSDGTFPTSSRKFVKGPMLPMASARGPLNESRPSIIPFIGPYSPLPISTQRAVFACIR